MRVVLFPLHIRPVAIFLTVVAIYFSSIPGNRSEAEDACVYAATADAADASWTQLLRPDHVLYFPLIRSYHALRERVGMGGRSYDQLVRLDLVAGAAVATMFYLLLVRRLAVGEGPAVLGALLLAFSYGPWRYSVEVEIPAWTNLFALCLLYLALAPSLTARKSFRLGVVAGSAILMHGLNSFPACSAIPAWLFFRHGLRQVVSYVLGAALLLTVAFGSIFLLRGDLEREINTVATLSPTWALVPKALVGLAQSVVAGNFLFGSSGFTEKMISFFPEKMLEEEILMGHRAPEGLFVLSVGTCLALAVAVLWMLIARLRLKSVAPTPEQGRYFVLWAVVFAIFAVDTNPGSFELWIPALVPIWTLVILYIIRPLFLGGRRAPCIAFAAALFLHNLVGGFSWIHDASADYNRVRAAWLVEHATDRDLIVTADTTEFSKCLGYWSKGVVLNTHTLPTERLTGLVHEIEQWPGTIYVMDAVFDPPKCLCLLRAGFCEQMKVVTDELRPMVSPVTHTPDVTVYAVR